MIIHTHTRVYFTSDEEEYFDRVIGILDTIYEKTNNDQLSSEAENLADNLREFWNDWAEEE